MSRDELFTAICSTLGYTTEEQQAIAAAYLRDIITAVELRHGEELLIADLTNEKVEIIKREAVRRCRSA